MRMNVATRTRRELEMLRSEIRGRLNHLRKLEELDYTVDHTTTILRLTNKLIKVNRQLLTATTTKGE